MKTALITLASFATILIFSAAKGDQSFGTSTSVYIPIQKDTSLQNSIKRGKTVYEDFCMQCHMATGEGIPGAFPPLAKADYLLNNRTKAIHAVKYGLQGPITVNGTDYNSIMAPLGLYDDEVADVMNYILNSWGNSSDKPVTEKEVAAIEK